MPDASEVLGLTALLLLQDSRREARADVNGRLLTLEEQDRGRWHRAQIDEGLALLRRASGSGPYVLQALVAACHAQAASADQTDWRRIAVLYARLLETTQSPVVALNHAVAIGMAEGPAAGLALVDELAASGSLGGYHLLPATRADLLRRLGQTTKARSAYGEALALTTSAAEREYLERRLSELS
jgi:RNA polymerase sigma-70 factor (ECF subfamily)